MSDTTKTLPAMFATCVGVVAFLITKNPVALFMFGIIAAFQYGLRNEPLHRASQFMFYIGGGACGALFILAMGMHVYEVALLNALLTALCVSVLYVRAKI